MLDFVNFVLTNFEAETCLLIVGMGLTSREIRVYWMTQKSSRLRKYPAITFCFVVKIFKDSNRLFFYLNSDI